jgi:hypothetical protein
LAGNGLYVLKKGLKKQLIGILRNGTNSRNEHPRRIGANKFAAQICGKQVCGSTALSLGVSQAKLHFGMITRSVCKLAGERVCKRLFQT